MRIYQTRERQTFHTDSCDIVGLLCLREAWVRRASTSSTVRAISRIGGQIRVRSKVGV